MEFEFQKYQGTGNDFIMIDDRDNRFPIDNVEAIAHWCHRRFGIGADGLILLRNAPEVDFQMVYFNADGRQTSMCGNGGRCIVRFAYDNQIIGESTRFVAIDGLHDAFIRDRWVHLKMIDVSEIREMDTQAWLNTGSPHLVVPVKDLADYPVFEEGKRLRWAPDFQPGGTNVNFVEQKGNHLHVRTFERGVEDETWSCGTGVTAAALSLARKGAQSPLAISTLGGELSVSFESKDNGFHNIFLNGPAEFVFRGTLRI